MKQANFPMLRPGRNQLCPCGSAKKFKYCHGKPASGQKTKTDHLPHDMESAVKKFSRHANEVVDLFCRNLDTNPVPSRIYHYTNDAGLRGILETGKLWLTDIFSLNDPSELRHGLNPAIEMLEVEAARGKPELKQFSDNMRAMLRGGIEEVAHYFACSFSKASDDLGQWRAYANGGRGYALGFDGEVLEQSFAYRDGVAIEGPMTFPVAYGDEQLRKIQHEIISPLVPLLSSPRGRDISSQAINDYMRHLSIELAVPILRSVLFFKHKSYCNESEYRFLHIFKADHSFQADVAPELKYRTRPDTLVRYIEFDWRAVAPRALKEIIVGPAANRDMAETYIRDCLRAFHADRENVIISQSGIPYRAT